MDANKTVSIANLQSNYSPINEPTEDNEIDLAAEFDAMIGRLCTVFDLPATDQATIIQNHLMLIDDVLVSLQLEEWSSHVKMYLDVGSPLTAHEEELHGLLLDRQANFPAPFMMAVARNPDNKRIMLIAFAPLTLDAESDQVVVHALTAAVLTAKGLREELGLGGQSSA